MPLSCPHASALELHTEDLLLCEAHICQAACCIWPYLTPGELGDQQVAGQLVGDPQEPAGGGEGGGADWIPGARYLTDVMHELRNGEWSATDLNAPEDV
jgi:hypothetical protein